MTIIKTPRGLDWKYEITGQGETLLFLHGFGVSQRIWVDQVKYFSSHYEVLTIDLPGHGQSGWMDVELIDMANDINFILNKLELHQVNIIASSFGGLIAFKLFKACPEKIQRVAFVGALPKFTRVDNYPAGLDIPKIQKLSEQLEGDYKSILDIFLRSLYSPEERASSRFQWIKEFQKTDAVPKREALLKFLDILEKEDLRDILSRIQYRVRFINGSEDYICPPEIIDWLEEAVPYARFDTIQNAGHFPFLTKPEEFNEILVGFLTA